MKLPPEYDEDDGWLAWICLLAFIGFGGYLFWFILR